MVASTIAAISTPLGNGGIGIIKISGPRAIEIGQSVFVRSSRNSLSTPHSQDKKTKGFHDSRKLIYGHIVDPDSKQIIDEVLFVIMNAPYSYTAEDVVEIQAHSGPLSLKSILLLLLKQGAVLAEPGEFTKRAFLNGRIDLVQAEAVIDIINARSKRAIDMAMAQISGVFTPVIESLRSAILDILSVIEASIDFSEETDDDLNIDKLSIILENQIIPDIENLISRYEAENFLRDGLKVVIIGGPNVGKSSLLNRMVNRDRAIVSEIPGTTRDFIEDSFIEKGVPIIVTDTAGIHENPDPIERIGIEKAWEHISLADIILYMVDVSKPLVSKDLNVIRQIAAKKMILVINKMDLSPENRLLSIPSEWQGINSVEISALYNQGIDNLKEQIGYLASESLATSASDIVPNFRHKTLLGKSLSSLTAVLSGFKKNASFELISIDLKVSLDALDEILGKSTKEEVLDQIFSKFCIGK